MPVKELEPELEPSVSSSSGTAKSREELDDAAEGGAARRRTVGFAFCFVAVLIVVCTLYVCVLQENHFEGRRECDASLNLGLERQRIYSTELERIVVHYGHLRSYE